MIATTSRHAVDDLKFEDEVMLITIDGQPFRFALGLISQRLLKALPLQRLHFEISASGYGIHWPDLDEDLSIEGLLRSCESDS
jgi:hypothetical protein